MFNVVVGLGARKNELPFCQDKKICELGVSCPIKGVCEHVILCKVEALEVWMVVELGGVAKENHTKANARR